MTAGMASPFGTGDEDMLANPYALFGIQMWIALPKDKEDTPADFVHAPKDTLPILEGEGVLRLILGMPMERAPGRNAVRCSISMLF